MAEKVAVFVVLLINLRLLDLILLLHLLLFAQELHVLGAFVLVHLLELLDVHGEGVHQLPRRFADNKKSTDFGFRRRCRLRESAGRSWRYGSGRGRC